MSRDDKTLEQDWSDSFPFLQGSRGAPFLIILPHAGSPRKLKKMLMEWLPAHWWLTPTERQTMREFWERWYKEHYKGGTADFLVRAAVASVCDDLGLRKHYLDRILPAAKQVHDGHGLSVQARALDMYKVVYSGKHFDRLRLSISGQRVDAVCYRTSGEYGEPEWYVTLHISHLRPLTESLAHTLSQSDVALLHSFQDYDEQVCLVFNSANMDSMVIQEEGRTVGWDPWTVLLPQDGFFQALSEELEGKGLRDFTILEVPE